MEETVEAAEELNSKEVRCANCGSDLRHHLSFGFKPRPAPGSTDQPVESIKCFPCSLRHRPMVRRSLIAATVVGTVLTLLNQGDTLISGHWNNALYWKIPLTYCVPFLVATYGALSSNRK